MYINNIEEINESDLQHLIDEEIIELKTLEYKEKLPNNTDSDKKKFLATISSFANANGGDVVFGIIEKLTTKQISKKLNCSTGTIRYNISKLK